MVLSAKCKISFQYIHSINKIKCRMLYWLYIFLADSQKSKLGLLNVTESLHITSTLLLPPLLSYSYSLRVFEGSLYESIYLFSRDSKNQLYQHLYNIHFILNESCSLTVLHTDITKFKIVIWYISWYDMKVLSFSDRM